MKSGSAIFLTFAKLAFNNALFPLKEHKKISGYVHPNPEGFVAGILLFPIVSCEVSIKIKVK
jgi:hypothetical protein